MRSAAGEAPAIPYSRGVQSSALRPHEAQHKIVNLLKTLICSSVFTSVCVFNVWPKITLLPLWPRDTKRLDTPARNFSINSPLFFVSAKYNFLVLAPFCLEVFHFVQLFGAPFYLLDWVMPNSNKFLFK